MVDRIVMNQGRAPSAFGAESLCQHSYDIIELLACEVTIGIGRAHQLKELFLLPIVGCGASDNLLSQHIERLLRNLQRVELAPLQAPQRGDGLDQLIAAQRKQSAL